MNTALPPHQRSWKASDRDAVRLCREWMVYLGAADVVAASGDVAEVCDLYSNRFLAWVDDRPGNLDVDAVRRVAGMAASDGRRALVFHPGGVFPDAQDQADALGVALFRYDARGGNLDGANQVGRSLRVTGLAGN
ncbi:hypothetical protein [Leifsonia sp. 71-9]|uniref:hypothetical protein n=1 Tax=Leifsonia sp. 71-9 TaxID=1895934 RepID=UPI0025C4E344|nr:hypothetical protein [Leifsonia sp. 71-9]